MPSPTGSLDSQRAAELAEALIRAADTFAEKSSDLDHILQSGSVWWPRVPEADAILRPVVEELVQSNPTQLSYSDTVPVLTYDTQPSLMRVALSESPWVGGPVDRHALALALQARISELANARTSRRLQFVVENLAVDGDVPRFFDIEFAQATDDERQSLYDDPHIRNPVTSAVAFATLDAPGDRTVAFEWGIRRVERFLNLIQGCGSDHEFGAFYPIHVIDQPPAEVNTVVRELVSGHWATSVRTHPLVRHARVNADLLSGLTERQIGRLVEATTSTNTTRLLTAIEVCLETLGEGFKPNLPSTRMLLDCSALEMLVGGLFAEDVSFRGSTAAIAERSTFLVGGDTASERQDFDRRVRSLYSKGSRVRHGGRPDIGSDDVAELLAITRRVALALLDRPDLQNSRQRDGWVQLIRYTTA
jgi:hypothetical protein